jgi:hypothetical protein
MHLNKITKNLRNKVIAGVLIFVTALGGVMGYVHQQHKINDLQMKLEMKQDADHKNQGMYSTAMDVQTIQNKFNELNSYKIFDGSMVLKHKYEYQRDNFLGLKSKGTLVANAKVYYEYKVDLKDAKVTTNGNTINITLPRASLNKDSVHMMNNTFKIVEKETKDNILMNEKDGKQLQRYWIESFSTSAIDKLEEYYDSGTMRDKLEENTRREVRDLINTLGLNNTNVKINIK